MTDVNMNATTALGGDGLSVLTGKVRLSFPNLVTPRAFEGGPAKYTAAFIFPQGHDLAALKEAIRRAAEAKWGQNIPPNLRIPIRSAAEKADKAGYEDGQFFVNTTGNEPPQLVGPDNTPVGEQKALQMFYAGCWVNAYLRAFAYDQRGNKGVSLGLNAVQWLSDGDRLGNRVDATKVFSPQAVQGAAQADPFAGMGGGGDQAPADQAPSAPSGDAMRAALFG